jgi:hypothetical protein
LLQISGQNPKRDAGKNESTRTSSWKETTESTVQSPSNPSSRRRKTSKKPNLNLQRLLDSDLTLSDSNSTVSKLSFTKPLRILVNLKVEKINASNFVKIDYDGMQFLSEKKIFLEDLVISGGSCGAKTVNGVDALQLNRTVLKKVSNQGQFVGNLTKEEIRIGERFYGDLISLDQNLVLDGMEIRKPRQTIPVKNLNVKNFVSPGRVFGEDMWLIQDSLVFNGTEQIIAKKMFLGGLKVEDLRFTESNSPKAPSLDSRNS